MANDITNPPRRRRGWLRVIGWIAGILIVLVVVVYFVATSSAFFKGVILPRASKALNADITVSDASISPFSQVVLHDLKVQTTGAEPLVSAQEVRLRYSLMDIIKGNIHVDEVALAAPTVSLIQNPDGTSNLDPIMKAMQAKPEEKQPAPPAKPSKPMQIDLKKLALTDATIRQLKLYKNGNKDVTELSHVNVTLENIANGQTGKLALSADINVQNNPPAPAPSGLLQAKLAGNFALALTSELKPASVQGNTRFEVSRAEGAMAQLAGFATTLDCDVTPTDIKQVALRFQKAETPLGEVTVSGPFDMEKTEGRLAIGILNINKNLLNLAGAASGIDFGPTTFSSTNEIQLARAGAAITAAGQFNLSQFQLTRTNQTTPPLDLRLDYNVNVDRAASSALLRTLTLVGTQNGSQILRGELTSPMTIAWGTASGAVGESALNLAITHLNLADWKPFLGEVAPAGDVNAKLQLLSKEAGKQLSFDLSSEIDNLTAGAGSNQITQATVTLQARGQATDMKQFSFPEYKFQVARLNQPLVTVSGSGTYDQATQNADMQFDGQFMLAQLLGILPRPDISVSSGTATLKARLVQKQQTKNITGNLALADFTGKFGLNEVRNLGLAVDLDAGMVSQQVQLRKVTGNLTQGANAAGSFSVSGTYDTGSGNADVQADLQAALARLLEAIPQPNLSVSSGTVEVRAHLTQKQKAQAVTGTFALSDFTGQVASNAFNSFGATADLDVGMTPQQIQIRKVEGKLSAAGNAGGSFNLSGTYGIPNKSAQLTLGLADFNENGLRPFLQPALGDKTLISIAINGNASAQYDPQAASAVNGLLQVTNLVVSDPKGQFPKTPLEAKMQVDTSLNKQVVTLRQFTVGLTPTSRGANQVQLTGQVDMSQTNAIQGSLKLAADSLDLTTYYDLFAGQSKASANQPATTAPNETTPAPASAQANAGPEKEPEPVNLPLRNFTADAKVGHIYLHEMEVADLQAAAKVDGGHVVLSPLKCALNGAPVSSTVDLDLGVPGFKYDVAFSAQAIPLAPLVDSFQPERKGLLSGTLTSQAKITGAGITGAGLQKNLAGNFDLTTTNLNLSVDNIQGKTFYTRFLKTLVSTISIIPDLAKNPAGSALSAVEGLTGLGGSSTTSGGGLAADLNRSPINSIILHGTAGSGRVDLRQALVQSPAFEAQANGTVTLAAVLTNSTLNIPIAVFLERSVAQRINLAGNTPATATYARLPDFLTMTGTLGNPKSDINKVALASAVLQGVAGKTGQAGGVLQGLGSVLGSNPPAATNAPAANPSPVNNLLNGLFKPRRK